MRTPPRSAEIQRDPPVHLIVFPFACRTWAETLEVQPFPVGMVWKLSRSTRELQG